MAVARQETVIISSTNGDTIAGPVTICGILYKAGTGSPSASIAANSVTLWETAASSDVFNQVEIRAGEILTLSMAGIGTKLYIYTRVK